MGAGNTARTLIDTPLRVNDMNFFDQAADSHSACASVGEYLTFRLAQEYYGIDILTVQELRGYETPTAMAGAPAAVSGVLNLRGAMVPIMDLRSRLDIEPRFDELTVTVVLKLGGRTIGIVVDSVSDVVNFSADQLKPAPELGGVVGGQHITGLGSLSVGGQERLLILLDIEGLVDGTVGAAGLH